ncbi:Protein N-acetyltransferase, RimJ/RimL family [Blastococcus fimeti]|nr:Protein N-acetyltransferase, RimJ/RimL family [Blastococcus fimeti]
MTRQYAVRPVRAYEWREARALRLAALSDEAAPVAFLTSYAEASTRPDNQWQAQTRDSSVDAGPGAAARLFVAETDEGDWVGSVVARVHQGGEPDSGGAAVQHPSGYVAAVYLAPAHRGRGVLADLLAAATGWLREQGLTHARLHVHTENPRARRAYEKAGFVATGAQITAVNGLELEMVRAL